MAPGTIMSKALTVENNILMPVSGNGSNIPVGTILGAGFTANTNFSILIPLDATHGEGVTGQPVAILTEKHTYATSGDALTQTLQNWFPGYAAQNPPSHACIMLDTGHVVRISYDLTTAGMTVTGGGPLTYTVTALDAYWEGGFGYVNAGTGVGQLFYVSSSSAGTGFVLLSALTTSLDGTSRVVKILPQLYGSEAAATAPLLKAATATVPQLLATTAAAGTHFRAITLDSYIVINSIEKRLDPLAFNNYQSLNLVPSLDIYQNLVAQNCVFHPLA